MKIPRRIKEADSWSGAWSCDDITPNLCSSLSSTEHSVTVRGISVHYWIYENSSPTDTSTTKRPIVVIHGGPSWTHNYMLPLKQLACRGHSVIFYDQAGCGASGANVSDAPWLLEANYYALEEFPALIQHLEMDGSYHVIGNSFGAVIAMIYATHVHDPALQSLVLSAPVPDVQSYFAL